jgi:hypothetical protein
MAVGGIALKKIGDVKHVFDDGDHPGFFPAAIIALGALVFIIAAAISVLYGIKSRFQSAC